MSFYHRKDLTRQAIYECLNLLRAYDKNDQCKAIVLCAYILEQAFKISLSKVNPLLCIDTKQISPQKELLFALKRLSPEQISDIKTITASTALEKMCAFDCSLAPHKKSIADLFIYRNFILHSQDDVYFDPETAIGQAITVLRACKKHICKSFKLAHSKFRPLSSEEYRKIEHNGLLKELKGIRKNIRAHKNIYSQMTSEDIQKRLPPAHGNFNEIFQCPACSQDALLEIVDVDYDWNPDGVITSATTYYECAVCDLHLSSREEDLAESYKDFMNSSRATLIAHNKKRSQPKQERV